MRDVGDLPVLTFGSCVLKTGVIKGPLKLYVRFCVFNVYCKIQKHDFLRFFNLLHMFARTLVLMPLSGSRC